MEKEQILSELTTRLGQTSFSSQTLMKYIDLTPVAEGSEPDDAYYSKAVEFLQGMQGQYNHDVATEVEGFKKNYKPQQHSSEEGKNAEEGKLATQLEEMRKELAQLKTEREAEKNAASIRELREKSKSQLKAQIENGGKNICNDEILNIAISDVEITKDMKPEDIIGSAKQNYEKRYKAIFGDGASPSINSFASASEEQINSRREAFKERMRAQGKLPKKEQ
jgi:hypothetical protein